MIYDESLDTPLLREKRFRMVEEQVRMRSIFDKRILESMKRVPRHLFLDEGYWDIAYGDHPINIGKGKVLNQPFMTGLMLQHLDLRPQHKVLEVGTGLGYQAALIGEVVSELYTLEPHTNLVTQARQMLRVYGYDNVVCDAAKKTVGWRTKAPFDRIIVTHCLECVPKELLKQLGHKGIIVLPVGKSPQKQEILKVVKSGDVIVSHRIAEVCNLSRLTEHKLTPHQF